MKEYDFKKDKLTNKKKKFKKAEYIEKYEPDRNSKDTKK
jgi:hypothetical protein